MHNSKLVDIETKDGELDMANTPVNAEEEIRERVTYKSPYERWKESEGLPTYRGLFVKNVNDLELAPWKSSGAGLAMRAPSSWKSR